MSDRQLFIMYMAAIASIQFHPKNDLLKEDQDKIDETLEECADIAEKMVNITNERY